MTEREKIEKELLLDIVLESSKWRLSEGDDRDCIRLEVEQRLGKYMGISPEVVDGREQSVVERGLAKQKAKSGSRQGKVKDDRMRIMYKGHRITIDKEKLVKTPNMHSRTGYVWRPAPGVNLDDYIHPRSVDNAGTDN